MMRRILVSLGDCEGSRKRGGAARKLSLEDAVIASPEQTPKSWCWIRLLMNWRNSTREKRQIVEMRLFGRFDVEETAAVLGVSAKTVLREWSVSRSGWHAK